MLGIILGDFGGIFGNLFKVVFFFLYFGRNGEVLGKGSGFVDYWICSLIKIKGFRMVL